MTAKMTSILMNSIILSLAAIVSCAPIAKRTPRWTHPCGPAVSSLIGVGNPLPLPPLHTTLGEMANMTRYGVDYSGQLQQQYRQHRIVSNDVASFLENMHMTDFPLKKSTDEAMTDADADTGTTLKKDYKSLSKLAVWLEQVHIDEVTHHESKVLAELSRVEENVYAMLCKVDIALQSLNMTVVDHVTRSAMPAMYRRLSIAQTYQRDFIINKDTSAFIDSLEIQYLAMEVQQMPQ